MSYVLETAYRKIRCILKWIIRIRPTRIFLYLHQPFNDIPGIEGLLVPVNGEMKTDPPRLPGEAIQVTAGSQDDPFGNPLTFADLNPG